MSFGNIHNFQKTVWNFKKCHVSKNIRKFILIFYDKFEKNNMFQIGCCIMFLNIRACHWSIERVCSKRKTGCTGFIPGTRVEAQCCKAHTAGSTLLPPRASNTESFAHVAQYWAVTFLFYHAFCLFSLFLS